MSEVILNNMHNINLSTIGVVNSPYKEKFAIPRQPGLVSEAKGTNVNNADSVRGLEEFSHIWLLFIFHGTQNQGWKPLVKPPRLGGNKKLGVLATRSTFRPNPIGMSVVKLDRVETLDSNIFLHISGLDLLDQTPIVDIKPYIPYSDSLPNASASFAQTSPQSKLTITFSKQADSALSIFTKKFPNLPLFVEQVLAQDPRPAYKKNKLDDKTYGMTLYNLNIQWKMTDIETIEVSEIRALV